MNSLKNLVVCNNCHTVYGRLQIELSKPVILGVRSDNKQEACIKCAEGVKLLIKDE